tara:strand:- start:95 stop:1555 length:1461 start_codon:yes stop_codon:yes gene_type:complete
LIPTLIGNLQLDNINLNIINGLFSFRFPRPLVTSCYFFWGLYLALLYFKEEKYETRNFLLVGLCLSLVFVSYYYNFINLLILFFFLLIEKIFNKKKSYLSVNYKNILYSILVFLLLTSPYLYLYSVSENDFSTMIGMINLNFDLKIKLLLHFLSKIFTLKFFIVFLIITLLRYFLIRTESRINVKIVKFFYYLFIATIFSPFFFTIISPTISEIYHFLNWIIIISIFVLVIYLCLYLNFLTRKILINFPKFYNSTLLLLSIFLIVIFQYINYEKILNNENNLLRDDFIKLQKLVNQNSKELNNLLSFSVRSQVFWMLKDKKEFSSIESSISSLNFQQLEENFIKNLKFLNIDFENFSEIISNKKSSWRYNNEYIKYISWYKYQANSLVTFDNSEDFTKKEKEYIQTSSPTKTQQIILPRFEIRRLNNLFKDLNIDNYSEKPDIIILKKRSLISRYSNINNEIYCEIKGFDELKVFILNNLSACFEK